MKSIKDVLLQVFPFFVNICTSKANRIKPISHADRNDTCSGHGATASVR